MSLTLPSDAVRSPHAYEPELGGHLPVLDSVRGAAILLVMLFHFEHNAILATGFRHQFVSYGWCGVDLFFVLSGFLITGILYDSRRDAHYFRNFYMRRTLRIFPLYYATLALVAVGVMVAMHRPHHTPTLERLRAGQWWAWIYGTNIKVALAGGWGPMRGGSLDIGHFWSLAVEEHFYLIWPTVVLLLSRKAVMSLCGIFVVVALGLRYYFVDGPENYVAAYALTPCRMDALAMGAWIALAARTPRGVSWLRPWAGAVGLISGITVFGFAVKYHRYDFYDPGVLTIGSTCLDLFFAAILVLVITIDPKTLLGAWLAPRWLRSLGKYSYAIYIFHRFFDPYIERFFVPVHPVWLSIWLTIIMFCFISYGVAWLSWLLFERHFLKLKRFFPHSTREHSLEGRQPIGSANTAAE